MGLGITPDTQGATVDSLQIGSATNLYNETSDDYTILGNNVYFDGTNNKYIKTQESSRLMQNAGEFTFNQAVSGSADANITYTTPLKIDANGYVTKPNNLCLQYTRSASTDYTSGTVIYNTLVFDVNSSGAYNTSTGVFTAPVTGVYLIYHEFYAQNNAIAMTQIDKSTNGGSSFSSVKFSPRAGGNSSEYLANGCSFFLQMNVNDQFRIVVKEGIVHVNNKYTHLMVQLIQ